MRLRRHRPKLDLGWPGPPAPLPGGAYRRGDCWTDLLPTRPVELDRDRPDWDGPTGLLPVVTPGRQLRGEGGGWA